jgi:glycosyltransferase involved in cell wall biosynthesis
MSARKLIFLVTEGRYFYSHRMPMVRAAQKEGFEVAVITDPGEHSAAIEKAGVRVIPFSLERRNLSPWRALRHIAKLVAIYMQEKPDIVHHIAMKPVLLGSIAASQARVKHVVNAFAGLGYVFTAHDARAWMLKCLLLPLFFSLLRRRGSYLLLQNNDDLALLKRFHLAPQGRTTVIRGSGIDLAQYPEQPFTMPAPDFIVAFSGRMIGIKGLQTLKEAAPILQQRAPHVKLWLCGTPDPGNPGSWTEEQLKQMETDNPNIVYRGHCDMTAVWVQAHAAVQPSWGGEGVPKSLLEAAACGRAIVATDVPGCRDLVKDGENGFLVPPRDAKALADALAKLAADPQRCAAMGKVSRRMIENSEFTAAAVTARTAALYRTCLQTTLSTR